MSLKEQDQLEHRQESFSFSNYDFSSSSFGVVLSDGEDSDESYIEIELERAKSYRTGDLQSDEDEDGEIELRISISSHVPFPHLSIPSFSHAIDAAESGSSQSSSSSTTAYNSTCSFSSKASYDNKKAVKSKEFPGGRRGTVQFPAIGRLLSMLISSLKAPPEVCQDSNVTCSDEKQDKETEMPHTRKPSSKTRTTMNGGGIMKFFIKLRAMQAKALLASIMKTRDATATDPSDKRRTSGRERKQKPEATSELYRRMSASKSAKKSSPPPSLAGTNQCYHKSSSVRMNNNGDDKLPRSKMYSKKTVAEASINGRFKRTPPSSVSCPSSIRCSPLHAGENSIQAAIAHCKNSFAPFPGFYF